MNEQYPQTAAELKQRVIAELAKNTDPREIRRLIDKALEVMPLREMRKALWSDEERFDTVLRKAGWDIR